MKNQTTTNFGTASAMPAANTVVNEQRNIELTEKAWMEFWSMVESKAPAPELARREAAAFIQEMNGDLSL